MQNTCIIIRQNYVQSFFYVCYGALHDAPGNGIALVGIIEDQRREFSKIARYGRMGVFNNGLRIVFKLFQNCPGERRALCECHHS